MPNIQQANFALPGQLDKRRLKARLEDDWIDVKEHGVTGNGTTDDTAAIKALLDLNFGTKAAPHGAPWLPTGFKTGDLMYTNRALYFPAGDYKVSSMLRINVGYGINLIGDGSEQTRIFWSGPTEAPPVEELDSRYSALITFYMCWGSSVSGITFDAGNTQQYAFKLYHWPTTLHGDGTNASGVYSPPIGDDGSVGLYRDVVYKNGTSGGFISSGQKMGSERTFVNCKFLNNGNYGHRQVFQNALNHSFYNCHFEGNQYGTSAVVAGHASIVNCTFVNNSYFSIAHQYGPARIVSNRSSDPNFVCCDATMMGNLHTGAGLFVCYQEGGGPTVAANINRFSLIGNRAPSSKLGIMYSTMLRGNEWGNPAYKDIPVGLSGRFLWENGATVP